MSWVELEVLLTTMNLKEEGRYMSFLIRRTTSVSRVLHGARSEHVPFITESDSTDDAIFKRRWRKRDSTNYPH